MIYITGDTHAQFYRFMQQSLEERGIHLTESDYVIVCGDFCMCWTREKGYFEKFCEFFSKLPFTVLWVQGNHENYDMIAEFSVEEWNGGKVRHILRDKVILLERGQVFTIEGKTFFTFGGAASHDIQGGILERSDELFEWKVKLANKEGLPYRILGESWWSEELPTQEEMVEGMNNLARVGYKVDYVITHCCASAVQRAIDPSPGQLYIPDVLTDFFDSIEKKLQYEHWFFGHYHDDFRVDEKHTLLFHAIVPLEEIDTCPIPRLGHPRFERGDRVSFDFKDGKKVGVIDIVDRYGTFDQSEEPSYDVFVEEENCLFKHIVESRLRCVQELSC